jgi:ANTAR domain
MSVNEPRGRPSGRDDEVVVRKGEHGWVVGEENVSDLTSAIVLADLFAADHAAHDPAALEALDDSRPAPPTAPAGRPAPAAPASPDARSAASPAAATAPSPAAPSPAAARRGGPKESAGTVRDIGTEADEAARLAVTVTQLEHALASRVRVEQAIGVLAERHRLRPREAFDLLRRAARARGRRVTEIAQDVVASTANPLLRLPEELARKMPESHQRSGRAMRRPRHAAERA